MASLIDLAPTILSTAGINPPDHYEGADLTGTFQGSDTIPGRKYIFSEHKPLGPFHGEVDLRMITDNHIKYIWNRGDTDELYNLDEDPGELNNLIAHSEHQEKFMQLCGEFRLELHGWMERTQDPLLNDFLKDNIGR